MTAVNMWFDDRKDSIEKIVETLTRIDRNTQIASRLEKDFFTDEMISIRFFQTGESPYLEKRQEIVQEIQAELSQLLDLELIEIFEITNEIRILKQRVREYDIVFQSLLNLTKERGFKDYGLEGQMRRYIHDIEEKLPFESARLLTIRRHEKDFIIRKDTAYYRALRAAVPLLAEEIRTKVQTKNEQKNLLELLEKYENVFGLLVQMEARIGFDHYQGTKKDLNLIANDIDSKIARINEAILDKAETMHRNITRMLLIAFALGAVANIFLAFYSTQILSRPIMNLSSAIHEVIKSDFSEEIPMLNIDTKDEISRLAKDFVFMIQKVQVSLSEVKEKSNKIEQKQALLIDSIRYAQKIQEAILPDEEDVRPFIGDYFVIYRPLHGVSGDFYWFLNRYEKNFVAVVDCTGHGVPGAFMSMIGHTLLTKVVAQDKIFDPAKILEALHEEIRIALHQQGNRNDDGMDIGLCMYEELDENIFHVVFAGAKSAFIYSHDHEVLQVKGANRTIGGRHKPEARGFENYEISLKKGEMLYLYSDGFTDQQNLEGEKYSKKRLRSFVENIWQEDLTWQKTALETEFENFLGAQAQRDDITVLGLRL